MLFNLIECFCFESPERLEVGQEEPAWTATASLRRQTHSGALRGAHSQFIDIQGFDPLTTGMSLRLRQPGLYRSSRVEKPGGPPSLLPTSTPLSWWSNQSSTTMSHVCGHILSFFLCFLSLVLLSRYFIVYFNEVTAKEFPAFILKPGTASPGKKIKNKIIYKYISSL